jgi:peptide deformylase
MTEDFTILLLGNPKLRLTAEEVNDISSANNQAVFKQLMDFVLKKKGMGIAAPQVDISQRFFIMSSHPNSRYPHAPVMEPTLVVNPKITWVSEEMTKDWEGCLSVPGVRALVSRHDEIDVSYTLANNQRVETRYSGFLARIFQHELDHLDGIVFLDRIETTHDVMVEAEWQKQCVTESES